MTPEAFERAFRALLGRHEARDDNPGCIACDDCRRCRDSTFCKRSVALVRCHYCVESERCVDCTHCREGRDLIGCNHCVRSQGCSRSAYLERCVDCSDCNYCFGCVGLTGREFYILNERYDRQTYFQRVAELTRGLAKARWPM